MNKYEVEYTDLFCGEANYSWVVRKTIHMPELTHYGYDGSTNYCKANRRYERELMRRAKASVGLTSRRGKKTSYGDAIEFRPVGGLTIMFVTYVD